MTMTACVPCTDCNTLKVQRIDRFLPTTRMLVTTMKKHQRVVGCIVWDPRTVKQLSTVPTRESSFNGLHLSGAIRSPHRGARRQSHRCHSYLSYDRNNCEVFRRTIEIFVDAEIVCL